MNDSHAIGPRVTGRRRRAALTSLMTSSGELLTLSAAATFVGGTRLVVARWIIGLFGSSIGFLINRRWSYRERGTALHHQAWRFGVVLVAAVTIATLLFGTVLALTRFDARVVHVLSAAVVFGAFTQPLLSGWVFRSSSDAPPA